MKISKHLTHFRLSKLPAWNLSESIWPTGAGPQHMHKGTNQTNVQFSASEQIWL